jgi:hypothetical protein
VGHLARIFESAGLSTVVIAAQPFRMRLASFSLPRLLITPHPMGRVLGAPGDTARHLQAVETALALLAEAPANGSVVVLPGSYR